MLRGKLTEKEIDLLRKTGKDEEEIESFKENPDLFEISCGGYEVLNHIYQISCELDKTEERIAQGESAIEVHKKIDKKWEEYWKLKEEHTKKIKKQIDESDEDDLYYIGNVFYYKK